MRRTLGSLAAAVFALVFALQPAWAQRPPPEHPVFGHTLYSTTGMIATPHAFASPTTIFGTGTAIVADRAPGDPNTAGRLGAGIGLGGWVEAGGTMFDTDQFGLFAKAQLTHQRGIFPAIALGVVNGTTASIGRFGINDAFYDEWYRATSFYAVLTYVAGPGGRGFPSWVVISGGWGSGIFLEDNPQFEGGGSGGAFGSVAFDFKAGEGAFIRTIAEWDGYDLNIGATAWLEGLELTFGILSIDEGDAPDPLLPGETFDPTRTEAGVFYNQAKWYASLTLDARVLGKLPWIWTGDEEQ